MAEGIAVVAQSTEISARELTRVTAALQTQVQRDLETAWQVAAPVNPVFRLEDVPPAHWLVTIRDDAALTAIHLIDASPVGVAPAAGPWPVAVSRLVVELLVNPTGLRRIAGPAPDGDGEVEFVVASTAAGGPGFTYPVHGIDLSDFALPPYYRRRPGPGPCSAAGLVDESAEVLPGGWLTWWDPGSDRWWRRQWRSGSAPELVEVASASVVGAARWPRPVVLGSPAGPGHRPVDRGRPAGAVRRAHRVNDYLHDLAAFVSAGGGADR